MARDTSTLQEELDKPSPKQKAELARMLIDSLGEDLDETVEQLWLDEAARRYEVYRRGEMSFHPAAEVFARVRARLQAMNLRFFSAEFGQAPLWAGGQAHGVSA